VKWKIVDSEGVEVLNVLKSTNYSVKQTDSGMVLNSYATLLTMSPLPLVKVQCSTTEKLVVGDSLLVNTQYAPQNISVTAPGTVQSGDMVTATCTTGRSFPATSMYWVVEQGDKVDRMEVQEKVTEVSGGGVMTSSTITVMSGSSDPILLECYANHVELLDQTLAYAHIVSVISAPGLPVIRGHDAGLAVAQGSQVSLYCSALAGNPPGTITWYKGHKLLESTSELMGDIVTAYVTFVADEGPQIELTCEASSQAIKGSLKETVTIKTIPPLSTTTSSTTTISTTTPATTSSYKPSTSPSTRSSQRMLSMYDRPVADMPVEEDELYDYSHFSYLNERFEENYKETLAYAEQYYDEDYQYVEHWGVETTETDTDNTENSDKIRDIKNILNNASNNIKSNNICLVMIVFLFTARFL